MYSYFRVLLLWLAVTLSAGFWPDVVAPARAQTGAAGSGAVRVDSVEAELVAERTAVVPGQAMRVGVRLKHDRQWHTYWRNPGDSGLPTRVDLELPAGFSAGPIQWPAPQRLFIPPLANYGYEGEIVLLVRLEVPPSLSADAVRMTAQVSWLVCRELCIPGEARLQLVLPVQRDAPAAKSRHAALFAAADARTPRGWLETAVRADGAEISVALDGRATSVEFFPYEEGLIDNAADQVLYAAGGEGGSAGEGVGGGTGMVLRVRLGGEGLRQVQQDAARALAAATGVVVIDGVARETKPRLSLQPLPAGIEIGRARGVPAPVAEAAARADGWLAALVGRQEGGAQEGAGAPGPSIPGQRSGPSPAGQQPSSGVTSDAGAGSRTVPAGQAPGAKFASATLWLAVFSGVLGGLILNLMPCVFPVIGLKVLDFTRNAGHADVASRRAALAFAAGVLVSFWALAALLLLLRAGGEAAGWGFQLQSPVFVAAMAMLFIAIGLNFSGVYEIGLSMMRLGAAGIAPETQPGSVPRSARWSGSFVTGVLAVLVATPCTAPFMGSAMGFTLASSARDAMIVFTAIAVGMAAPYVLLGFFPQALRALPRPGRWMESVRQFLAFPMYATAAWLAWVLGQQAGIDAVFALATGAVLLGLAAWLYGRFVQYAGAPAARGGSRAGTRRFFAGALAVASLAAGVWLAWPAGGSTALPAAPAAPGADTVVDGGWQPWSAEAVARARDAGGPVFVEFTAAWCVSCQVNKRLVLDRASIVARMNELGVVRFRADWTNRDPAITAALAGFGRTGVPLYLWYRPGADEPEVLPEILTPGLVREVLDGTAS